MLVRGEFVDRLHVRGRARRPLPHPPGRLGRPGARPGRGPGRALIAIGFEALADAPRARLARLEELDVFYAWWQSRMPALDDEWQAFKRGRKERKRDG